MMLNKRRRLRMNLRQDASAVGMAGTPADPHGWLTAVAETAPVLALCTVAIVVVLCATVILLVRSTRPSERLSAITALVPVLLALASRLPSWLSAWRKL
jgi:hypothetical protein